MQVLHRRPSHLAGADDEDLRVRRLHVLQADLDGSASQGATMSGEAGALPHVAATGQRSREQPPQHGAGHAGRLRTPVGGPHLTLDVDLAEHR